MSLEKNKQSESATGFAPKKRNAAADALQVKHRRTASSLSASTKEEREAKQAALVAKLTVLLEPLVRSEGLLLLELQYRSEGGGLVLRLVIDRPAEQAELGGISLDECALISRQASDLLDVEDLIPRRYRLEVSSPGLTRKLKTPRDFEIFSGRLVKLVARGDDKRAKTWLGHLKGLQGQEIIVEIEGVLKTFPLAQVVRANLEI